MKRHPDRYFGEGTGKIPATPDQMERIKSISLSTQSIFSATRDEAASRRRSMPPSHSCSVWPPDRWCLTERRATWPP